MSRRPTREAPPPCGAFSYGDPMAKTIHYLSRKEVAERIGVKPDTLGWYRLPEPDALIGTVRGWLPHTIDKWDAGRPSRSK